MADRFGEDQDEVDDRGNDHPETRRGSDSTSPRLRPSKIISGGQTGVDRAALDVAIELAIDHGGWCPRGRSAEDGPIDARYQLTEMTVSSYPARTRQNVTDSDATLILYRPPMGTGTSLTLRVCRSVGRPHLVVHLESIDRDEIQSWLDRVRPRILNVAGPRESQNQGVYDQARRLLISLFE